jgi:4-azaleucine resistance transporter AzlC
MEKPTSRRAVFKAAFKYSIPVLLGYLAIGAAFGLLIAGAGYPWWLALVMSLVMYAGAGQYYAVGLFAAGTSLWEAALIQLVINARHIAYGFSMLNRYANTGIFRYYLIFGMTDETFALLSSLDGDERAEQGRFMLYVTALDQCYWVAGSVIGALAGTLLPFIPGGISYALTALFVVLLIEQILRVRRPGVFIASAIPAVLCVIFLPSRFSLLAALALSLAASSLIGKSAPASAQRKTP